MRTILLHNSIANNPCRTCWRSIYYGNTQLATEWSMSLATPSHTSQALLVSHLLYMQALHILRRCTAGNRVVPQAGLHHPIPNQCRRFHSGSGLRRCFHQEDLRGRFSAASHQLCREVSHCECCCFKLLRQLYAGTSFAVISTCCCQLLLQFKHNALTCCSVHAVKSRMMAYQLPQYTGATQICTH